MTRVSRQTFIALGLVTALLLCGLAVAMLKTNNQSHKELEQRLGQRASIAAALIESTLQQTVQSSAQTDVKTFGKRTVTEAQVKRSSQSIPGSTMVVADAKGHVLAAWPHKVGHVGDLVTTSYPGARAVLAGTPYRIDVAGVKSPTVSLAIGIDTAYGRRIVVTDLPPVMMQAFLTGYLSRIAANDTDQAYVVDASGIALGYSGEKTVAPGSLPVGKKGRFTNHGSPSYYSSAAIKDSTWRVIITVPLAQLYAPVTGLGTWLPWILFLGFALTAGASLVLLGRLSRGAGRLQILNSDLEIRNQEVLASDRMKRDFLATMSHELRTPLNGIIGFAELMHDGRVGPVSEQHKEYLHDILSSSNHLRRLIDDVLDLSKIEAGKMDLNPEPVEIDHVVEDACAAMASLAVRKRISLRTKVDSDIGTVEVDPGKLKQVLFNYLSNAVKFTPEGGHITVHAELEGPEHYRIIVEDDGPGIAPENMVRLWSAFEQLETGAGRRYGGTGLGLSLTKRIVEAQGGTAGVESTLGEGARFWVVMPRVSRLVGSDDDLVREPAMVG